MNKQDTIVDKKNKQFLAVDRESLDSETGYKDTGNDAQVHGKARAVRNNENGSHH